MIDYGLEVHLRFTILALLFVVPVLWGCGSKKPCDGAFCADLDGDVPPDDGSDDVIFGGGDAGTNDGNGCALKCSGDFHAVLDCNDNVIQACTGNDGCDAKLGTCGNACQAAVNNKQSVGCEYYATHMHQYSGATYCFAAFVANTWNTPAKITVDFNGMSLPIANFARIPMGSGKNLTYGNYPGQLAPGQVAILFLGGSMGAAPLCPAPTAVGTAAMVTGTGKGYSFHINTDVPVVAYEMNPYGGGSVAVTGASLLLPTSSWDTNYIANTASPQTVMAPSINIIAAQDGTQVTLLPIVAVAGGGGLPSGPANTQLKFTLNKGEQAQFEQQADLVGSVIQTTKPVGLMAGNPCMNTPMGTIFCDHGEQMVPPVGALGSEYVGVMYRPRGNEPAIYRLVGAVDMTTLKYLPTPPAMAPNSLNRGQMAEFQSATPFVVTSQDDKHPFEFFTYMSGSGWAPIGKGSYGDPDFSVGVPPAQYMSDYVFFTDPTFPETNLVVIRKPTSPNMFADVNLDCMAQPLSGWQNIGQYQWTRVDLSTGDFANVGNCSNGRHEMKSKGTFGLNVWGWGTPLTMTFTANVSYSYPAGMNVQTINSVVVPPTPK